jgi:hypothetical protein
MRENVCLCAQFSVGLGRVYWFYWFFEIPRWFVWALGLVMMIEMQILYQ